MNRRNVALAAVHAVPGSHLRALQRISRLSLGTLRWHVASLVEGREIESEWDRRFARYYPVAMRTDTRRIWDALRERQTRLVVTALLHERHDTQSGLAIRLGIPAGTLNAYVQRLRRLHVLDAEGLSLRDAASVRVILDSVHPTYLDRLTDGAIGLFDAF
jgi:predicted transcriptional regulator